MLKRQCWDSGAVCLRPAQGPPALEPGVDLSGPGILGGMKPISESLAVFFPQAGPSGPGVLGSQHTCVRVPHFQDLFAHAGTAGLGARK